MNRMRPLVVAAVLVLLGLCGCRTSTQSVNRVFDAYAGFFPEAQRVPAATSGLSYFVGVYHTYWPGGGGFTGNNLYLFPNAQFILTEWGCLLREQAVMSGDWRYVKGCIRLTRCSPADPQFDLTYVPLRFKDSRRDALLLMGTRKGYRSFTAYLEEKGPEIRKARELYDGYKQVRDDFAWKTRGDELLYLAFFSGSYARDDKLTTDYLQAFKREFSRPGAEAKGKSR